MTVLTFVGKSRYPELFLPLDGLGFGESNTEFYANGIGPDGKFYTLAGGVFIPGLIANRAALRKVGAADVPDDWAGFLALCGKLKKAGVVPLCLNYASNWPLYPVVNRLVKSIAGDPSWFANHAKDDSLFAEGSALLLVFRRFR